MAKKRKEIVLRIPEYMYKFYKTCADITKGSLNDRFVRILRDHLEEDLEIVGDLLEDYGWHGDKDVFLEIPELYEKIYARKIKEADEKNKDISLMAIKDEALDEALEKKFYPFL